MLERGSVEWAAAVQRDREQIEGEKQEWNKRKAEMEAEKVGRMRYDGNEMTRVADATRTDVM